MDDKIHAVSYPENKKPYLTILIIFYISFFTIITLFIIYKGWNKIPYYSLEVSLFFLAVFSAYSLGNFISQKLVPNPFYNKLQSLIVSLALGFTGLSLISLLLGTLKLLHEEILWGILIALSTFGLIKILKQRKSAPFNKIMLSLDEKAILMLFWAIILVNMLSALSPVIFYDALVYHLNIPMEYLKAHRIFHMPYNMHSNLPQGMGMIYIYTLLLKSGVAAKLLNFFFGLLIALTIYSMARLWLNRRAALIAMLLFYSIPQIFLLSSLVNVDLSAAFYMLLGFYFLIGFSHKLKKKLLLLSGIFCGTAMSFRYQSALIAGMLFLLIFFIKKKDNRSAKQGKKSSCSRKKIRELLSGAFIFCLALIIIFSPWMIKNIIYTGNPLFPLFYSIFGGRGWSQEQATYFYNNISGRIGAGLTLQSWLDILWQALNRGDELGFHHYLFLAALALIPVALIRRHPSATAGLLGLLYFALWCAFSRNVANILRYNVFSFALLSLFFISFIWQWFKKMEKLAVLSFILLIIIEALLGILFCQQLTKSFIPVFTNVSRVQYVTNFFPAYALINDMNNKLSSEDKVLFIGETRGFYLHKKCIVSSANDGQWTAKIFYGAKNAEEVHKRMRALGITHLLVNQQELERLRPLFGYLKWKTKKDKELFETYLTSRKPIARYKYIYLLLS
jgi:hypothetical protein